ncbi:MAG: phenylacetate-CoA oxygenase subunit PaaC [Proteobacteria bacterium]|nr:phenylacetate-CoA oxygenase subunit PaaC [Pseudomonadota bacterium]
MPIALARFALALADDALVLGHRLSQWSSRAPTLEEDIALSNLALDLIGQARLFYTFAGATEGKGRSEDDLAYFRGPDEFRNVLMVELPNGDFAFTMVRQLIYSAMVHPYFEALAASRAKGLAEIAAKAVKEMAYHVRHASDWVIRLGDGTDESHRRAQAALDALWPYAGELFEMDETERGFLAQGMAPDRAALRPQFDRTISPVLHEARLARPTAGTMHSGGRAGRHSEHLAPMLADMQVLARAHPGVTW